MLTTNPPAITAVAAVKAAGNQLSFSVGTSEVMVISSIPPMAKTINGAIIDHAISGAAISEASVGTCSTVSIIGQPSRPDLQLRRRQPLRPRLHDHLIRGRLIHDR